MWNVRAVSQKDKLELKVFSIPVTYQNAPFKIKVQHTEISEGVAALTEDMILSCVLIVGKYSA